MINRSVIICAVLILVPMSLSWATPTEFVEKYTYAAGEADSKLTCRTISLIEVKRLLLEKLGTYLVSRTEVKNYQIEKDEVLVLTAGIVKLEILDEKWNGDKYSLTARIEADPGEVAKAIEKMQKQDGKLENMEKLEQINEDSLEQLREMQSRMQQLQSDLVKLNQDANANQGLVNAWGLFEKAVEWRQSGKTKAAIEALDLVIQNNPTHHLAYFERGLAYLEEGRYNEAIADLNEILKVEPDMRGALWARGVSYMKSGQKRMGRQDIEKSAALGNQRAKKWLQQHPGPGR
jgi:tetratricopeptide (TPR) repeat protein